MSSPHIMFFNQSSVVNIIQQIHLSTFSAKPSNSKSGFENSNEQMISLIFNLKDSKTINKLVSLLSHTTDESVINTILFLFLNILISFSKSENEILIEKEQEETNCKEEENPVHQSYETEITSFISLSNSSFNDCLTERKFEFLSDLDSSILLSVLKSFSNIPTLYLGKFIPSFVQIIPNLISTLFPFKDKQTSPSSEYLNYFTSIVQESVFILQEIRFNQIKIDPFYSKQFSKNLIQLIIKLFSSISIPELKSTSSTFTMIKDYFGIFLPLFTEISQIHDNEIDNHLHTIWLFLIILTNGGVAQNYPNYVSSILTFSNNLPTLSNYNILLQVIDELFTFPLINISYNIEEIAQNFCSIASEISPKTIQTMDRNRASLLTAIGILELFRANTGFFTCFFNYFQVELDTTFNSCIDAIVVPIFGLFSNKIDNSQVFEIGQLLFDGYISPYPRVALVCDRLCQTFFNSCPSALFSSKVIHSYLNALQKTTKQQSLVFLGRNLFSDALKRGPELFISTLLHSAICDLPKPIPFMPILNSLPSSEAFFAECAQFSYYYGIDSAPQNLIHLAIIAVKTTNFELLPKFINFSVNETENTQDGYTCTKIDHDNFYPDSDFSKFDPASMMTDEKKIITSNFAETSEISDVTANPDQVIPKDPTEERCQNIEKMFKERIRSWTYLMNNYELGHYFERMVTIKMTHMITAKKGIFGSSLHLVQEDLDFQQLCFAFFYERLAASNDPRNSLLIFSPMFKSDFVDDSKCIKVFLPLACCLARIIDTFVMNVPEHHRQIVDLFIKVLMYISAQKVKINFSFLTNIEIYYFEVLMSYIPRITNKFIFTISSHKGLNPNSTLSKNYGVQYQMKILTQIDLPLYKKVVDLLAWIICNQFLVFEAFLLPNNLRPSITSILNEHWLKPRYFYLNETIPFFLKICPESLPTLIDSLFSKQQIYVILNNFFEKSQSDYFNFAKDKILLEMAKNPNLIFILAKINPSYLTISSLVHPNKSLRLLNLKLLGHEETSKYVIRCLNQLSTMNMSLYVPQFIQALRYDKHNFLHNFILSQCSNSYYFCTFLLWSLLYEKRDSVDMEDINFSQKLVNLESAILIQMSPEDQKSYSDELDFLNQFDHLSQSLKFLPLEARQKSFVLFIKNTPLKENLFVPTALDRRILKINADKCCVLKSAEHVPILLVFETIKDQKVCLSKTQIKESQNKIDEVSCILKANDDVRADRLMIQLLVKCRQILLEAGIGFYLRPYLVATTGERRGAIGFIRDAKSRHDIGKEYGGDLLSYFVKVYGHIGTSSFEKARENFIKSAAAYSAVCYLFQIKDRHNANIMLDSEGHVIHIDFAFIFNKCPGGSVKFERADIKLTHEMVVLMGGLDSIGYKRFCSLFAQSIFAIRERRDEIIAIVKLMKDSGLDCLTPYSITNLKERFFINRADNELMGYIQSVIANSRESSWTTGYDQFQYMQNGTFYV